MEILGAIAVAILIYILVSKKRGANHKNLTLKELTKRTFPKYKVIEKHGTVMICEINHRNEPDELVFIRVNSVTKKNIRNSGRMLIVDYPAKPTAEEMKRDFGRHLR